MSEEILNEIVEETTEELLPQRVNPFCVISKEVFIVTDTNGKKHNLHMIETNSAWGANPYEDYAVVPDDMYEAIWETRGFCDITLNDDGTEVVEFTAREIPVIPEPPHEPTAEERIAELEAQLLMTDETTVALYESQMAQEEVNIAQDSALVEIFELLENI